MKILQRIRYLRGECNGIRISGIHGVEQIRQMG